MFKDLFFIRCLCFQTELNDEFQIQREKRIWGQYVWNKNTCIDASILILSVKKINLIKPSCLFNILILRFVKFCVMFMLLSSLCVEPKRGRAHGHIHISHSLIREVPGIYPSNESNINISFKKKQEFWEGRLQLLTTQHTHTPQKDNTQGFLCNTEVTTRWCMVSSLYFEILY